MKRGAGEAEVGLEQAGGYAASAGQGKGGIGVQDAGAQADETRRRWLGRRPAHDLPEHGRQLGIVDRLGLVAWRTSLRRSSPSARRTTARKSLMWISSPTGRWPGSRCGALIVAAQPPACRFSSKTRSRGRRRAHFKTVAASLIMGASRAGRSLRLRQLRRSPLGRLVVRKPQAEEAPSLGGLAASGIGTFIGVIVTPASSGRRWP